MSKILGKVDVFSYNSNFPQNVAYVLVSYLISDFSLGVSSGQVAIPADANQSEQQFVNDLKNQLADQINAMYGTSFNIADVVGCGL